jgi:hypothetical protein
MFCTLREWTNIKLGARLARPALQTLVFCAQRPAVFSRHVQPEPLLGD